MQTSPGAGMLAALALNAHLMKVLHKKGLISNEDYQDVLRGAIDDLSTDKNGAEAIEVIRTIAKI